MKLRDRRGETIQSITHIKKLKKSKGKLAEGNNNNYSRDK